MLRDIDNFYLQYEEPLKSCLLALRDHVLHYDKNITEVWRYRMPFYNYKGKRFCYIWADKKRGRPYIGFVDGNRIIHPELIAEKRNRMKILLIEPAEDLPVDTINLLLMTAIQLLKERI